MSAYKSYLSLNRNESYSSHAQEVEEPASYTEPEPYFEPASYPMKSMYPGSMHSAYSDTAPLTENGNRRQFSNQSSMTLNELEGVFASHYGQNFRPPSITAIDQQSRYSVISPEQQRPLARYFDPQKQLGKLLAYGSLRWFLTVAIAAAIVVVLKVYLEKGILNDVEKRVFNTAITGLSICLGINIASSFKALALNIRWKLIATSPHKIREAAQVAVAMLGLTYSINDGSGGDTLFRPGKVLIPSLDQFYPAAGFNTSTTPAQSTQQYTAHNYGDIAAGYPWDYYKNIDTDVVVSQALTFDAGDHWVYRFYELDPTRQVTGVTNRTIEATAACERYAVLDGEDGLKTSVKYQTPSGPVTMDFVETAAGATTYKSGAKATCGNRCSIVWAFQSRASRDIPDGLKTGSVYKCNITLGQVTNAYLPQHSISDSQARLITAAIGLEGYYADDSTLQHNRYHEGAYWAQPVYSNATTMGWLITNYAAGVVAAIGELAPKIEINGNEPYYGVTLSVKWLYVLLTLGGLCISQLVIFLVMTFFSNSVVVKDDSHLATARLLRPLVERLGPSGCMLDGSDISHTLRSQVVYGVKSEGEWHHLDICETIAPLKKFPPGWYDGEVAPSPPKQLLLPPAPSIQKLKTE
ncbi:MAG: hypothetical protein M1829_001252 [Trizodia sp. TS-e1964]|nr:MAG: hypothetical protein M1829_001252 [Trizodia sp. TS-e1964]